MSDFATEVKVIKQELYYVTGKVARVTISDEVTGKLLLIATKVDNCDITAAKMNLPEGWVYVEKESGVTNRSTSQFTFQKNKP